MHMQESLGEQQMACTPPKIRFGAIDAQLIAYGAGGMVQMVNKMWQSTFGGMVLQIKWGQGIDGISDGRGARKKMQQ